MDTSAPQPAPKKGRDEVLPYAAGHLAWTARLDAGRLLLDSLIERAKSGEKKYGTVLKTFNGRDAIVDAFQEAQDAVMYLGQKHLEDPLDVRVDHLEYLAEELALGLASYIVRREKLSHGG